MSNIPWWGYVVFAGLAWGTYVPLIFYGGTELTTKPGTIGGRLASILCVGVAYFVMAVVIPIVLMYTREDANPDWKANGLLFSALAGVMGAVGAICVIFASKSASDKAVVDFNAQYSALTASATAEPDPAKRTAIEAESEAFKADRGRFVASYRILIAPLIFSLAPLINTLMSLFWHPKPGSPLHFGFETPTWHLPVGIVLVAAGTFLVLYSKEAAEANKVVKPPTPAATS